MARKVVDISVPLANDIPADTPIRGGIVKGMCADYLDGDVNLPFAGSKQIQPTAMARPGRRRKGAGPIP